MNLILDTSAYSALQRGNDKIRVLLNNADQIYLPLIVLGELKAGFAFGTKQMVNDQLLTKFLADPAVSLLNMSEHTPIIFAELYASLRRTGHAMSQNDLWIAALAREHQLPLLTLDNDFRHIGGIELVKPG